MALLLLEAIRQKYCPEEEDDLETLPTHKPVKETATIYRPGALPVKKLTSVVLDSVGITRVVRCKELSELCPNVLELHLGLNQISSWNCVVTLLKAFPKLQFLDLSQNLLQFSPADKDDKNAVISHPNLTTLILNSTMITWPMLRELLLLLPSVLELHLSLNGAEIIPTQSVVQFPSVKKLHINKCGLTSWEDFCWLSDAFPCLEQLIADSNPLQSISQPVTLASGKPLLTTECIDESSGQVIDKESVATINDSAKGCFKNDSSATTSENAAAVAAAGDSNTLPFRCLKYININNCFLSSWDDVDVLGQLESLTEASLLNIPIGDTLSEKERRMTYICRMQKLQKLNKSSISKEEREAAERWFVRLHVDNADPPSVYTTLVNRHGQLGRLADVNFGAKEFARLCFTFQGLSDRPPEEHDIDLQMSTGDLRSWIGSELLGVPSAMLMMSYVCKQLVDGYVPELMVRDRRQLYMYRMADGDEINIKVRSYKQHNAYTHTARMYLNKKK